MERPTERDLVLSARKGDLDAFGELAEGCRESVLIELTHLLGNRDDAEDVVQEALLRAYRKLSSLKEPYNFGGWVRQTARNIARNRLARGRYCISLEEHLTRSEADSETAETRVFDPREVPAIVALSRLSSRLRETARLAYLNGYSQKQVAHRLGVPLGTVKRRLWDGRGRMKEEVLGMSRMQDEPDALKVVPKIVTKEVAGEEIRVGTQGPGLYFGSIMETSHVEVCDFFDYPGGILTQSVQTQVVREVNILGRDCFEVLIEHSDCEPPEPNILDYFHRTRNGFAWIMRVTADGKYPAARFMGKEGELFPLSYSTGDHRDYSARAVDLKVGDRDYGRTLAVFWGWKNGTPAESFYTLRGRQVLHRRFVGPDAPDSQNYSYDKLMEEERRVFRGTDYRLWYDTVLRE